MLPTRGGYTCETINECRLNDLYRGGGTKTYLECTAFPWASSSSGMMKFSNRLAVVGYLVGLDSLEAKWDYTVGDEDASSIGNEPLNAVDEHYGVQSLRNKVDIAEFYSTSLDPLSTLMVDPDLQNILNSNLEVIIGDTIFKYVSENVIALIPNRNYTVLNEVREHGRFTQIPGVIFYDEQQDRYIDISSADYVPLLDRPTVSCGQPRIYVWADRGQNWYGVGLTLDLTSADILTDCNNQREYIIDWGDGTIESTGPCRSGTGCNWVLNQCGRGHDYNPALIPSGGSREFTIKVSAKFSSYCNSAYAGVNFYKEVKYTVFRKEDCQQMRKEKEFESDLAKFAINGVNYKVRGKMGQSPDPWGRNIYRRPKLWVEVILEKFKNGKWTKTTPYYYNYLSIYGHLNANCNVIWTFPLTNKYSRSKSYIHKIKDNLPHNWGTTKNPEFQLKCDVGTASSQGTFAINNTKLWY